MNMTALIPWLIAGRSKQLLCFVHGQSQKRELKHTTRNFDEFHNHAPVLTLLILTLHKSCFLLGRLGTKFVQEVLHFGGMAAK